MGKSSSGPKTPHGRMYSRVAGILESHGLAPESTVLMTDDAILQIPGISWAGLRRLRRAHPQVRTASQAFEQLVTQPDPSALGNYQELVEQVRAALQGR